MIDTLKIIVTAGSGGPGAISFRRVRYVARGGPDGGDGGTGGDIVLRVDGDIKDLEALTYRRSIRGLDGGKGGGERKSGRMGRVTTIKVPAGVIVYEDADGIREVVADLQSSGDSATVAVGGRGGKGNATFVTSQNRVPLIAEAGEYGRPREIYLEHRLVADVGVIGIPNGGKSSLLQAVSRARPEVANYSFSTRDPILALVARGRHELVLVELPGLLPGAHQGAGLGNEFLKHLYRVGAIVYLLDGLSENPEQDYAMLREELKLYDEGLLSKPAMVVVNKIDLPEVRDKWLTTAAALEQTEAAVHFTSAATGEGVEEMIKTAIDLVEEQRRLEQAQPPPAPSPTPQQSEGRPRVIREGNLFVLQSPRAERLVRRVDLGDQWVLSQLWHQFQRMGVARALELAGARPGAVVRIGEYDLEWK